MYNSSLSYEELLAVAQETCDIFDVVNQWNDTGTLIETQYPFLWQGVFKRNQNELKSMLINFGADENIVRDAIVSAQSIPFEGWMYYMYDSGRFRFLDIEKYVSSYFSKRNSFY